MTEESELCSFCGKSDKEAEILLAGPKALICSECIDCGSLLIQELKHGARARLVRVIQLHTA
jgi:ATP-dependent protease Clp ATPase subunit